MKRKKNLFIEGLKYNTKDFYNSNASNEQAEQKIAENIMKNVSNMSTNLSMHIKDIAKELEEK